MEIKIDFTPGEIDWENNAFLKVVQSGKVLVSIEGNKEGLISLAKQLLSIAYSKENSFAHYWPEKTTANGYMYGDLEEGSSELFIQKTDHPGRSYKQNKITGSENRT